MRKKLLLSAIALTGLVLAAGPAQGTPDAALWGCSGQFMPSTVNQAGEACAGGNPDFTGWIYIDGADGNPGPTGGYVSASNSGALDEEGLCASTEGDPEEEYDSQGNRIDSDDETPSCNEDLWREAQDT